MSSHVKRETVVWLVLSVILEAVASARVSPMTESFLVLSLASDERARISALVYVAMILIVSPFGWITGQLSALDRALPFALNMGLFAIGILLVGVIGKPGFLPVSTGTAEAGKTELRELQNRVADDANGAV